jgi:3-oxoacyl-[acyl-carrier-protein] synthase II
VTASSPPPTRPADASRKVLITGIGLITGLNRGGTGAFREETWDALRSGRSAVRILDGAADGEVRYLGCPLLFGDSSEGDPLHYLLVTAADEALRDAGLCPGTSNEEDGRHSRPYGAEIGAGAANFDRDRAAALIGVSKGAVRSLSRLHHLVRGGARDVSIASRDWVGAWPDCGASLAARRYDLRGPSLAPIAACATGLVAAIRGAELIRRGLCDVVLAGSVDASLEPLLLAAFRRMRVLADARSDPSEAVRPWDRRRSGFVVGEGGAILVLERDDHARARGVLPYAEFLGGALGSDAFHATDLNPDPSGLAHVVRRALETSRLPIEELDHVNVHGTATRVNDPLECRALRLALGPRADRVACSANKGQIGHLLGAAGAAELAIACLSIRDGFAPPTLNLDEPDVGCDLDGVPRVGRPMAIRGALKVSIGFGGHLAAAVLRRPDGPRRGPREG